MIKGKTNGRSAGTNAKNNQQTPANGGFGDENSKLDDLAKNKEDAAGEFLTTHPGVVLS